MKNTTTSVPIDFFGVAASQHVRVLLTTDSNRRARKSAFNNMERLAKIAGLFPKNVVVTYVAVYVDLNGYQGIRYEYAYESTEQTLKGRLNTLANNPENEAP